MRESGIKPELVLIDHNNEETLPLVLPSGCWAGHSIYPKTKMDEQRMVHLVKQYGGERMVINSAADWGVSDPLEGAENQCGGDGRSGHTSKHHHPRSAWDNPVNFFRQSGRLDLSVSEARPFVDQRQLWEGNSVLRGQSPSWIPLAILMNRVLVLNVAGLTLDLLDRDAPHLTALARQGGVRPLTTVTPAVTCSVQATFTAGLLPREHGIVANGWYFRELAEVFLWRQSNLLVDGAKIWDTARQLDPQFTCAKLVLVVQHAFLGKIIRSRQDQSISPTGGSFLISTHAAAGLRDELNRRLGEFPLFRFWGPGADIVSSQWIKDCARYVYDQHNPTLTLVYLPHLDYNLQRLGPNHPAIRDDRPPDRCRLRRTHRACAKRWHARHRAFASMESPR